MEVECQLCKRWVDQAMVVVIKLPPGEDGVSRGYVVCQDCNENEVPGGE